MSRDANREKLQRDLSEFEAENCDHPTALKILERMKTGRAARGTPIPEDFAQHFVCLKCAIKFLVGKQVEARRQGVQDAVQTLAASLDVPTETDGG